MVFQETSYNLYTYSCISRYKKDELNPVLFGQQIKKEQINKNRKNAINRIQIKILHDPQKKRSTHI